MVLVGEKQDMQKLLKVVENQPGGFRHIARILTGNPWIDFSYGEQGHLLTFDPSRRPARRIQNIAR